MILAPKHSAVMKVEEIEEVAVAIEGLKLVVVDVPGHEIYVTEAGKCQSMVLKFLSSLQVDSVN